MYNTKITTPANGSGQNMNLPALQKIGDKKIKPIEQPKMQGLMGKAPEVPTYTPEKGTVSKDSLVENRMTGLMSMDNPLMKKSVVNANNLSAQRGLQSSSIATENAVNSMYNYALPIAQQDASTYAQQDQLNQQNTFNAGMQNTQNQFQSGQNQADRNFNYQLEQLKQQNNLGLLDAESKIRLQELEKQNEYAVQQDERQANIQTQRDATLQGYQQANMGLENEYQTQQQVTQSALQTSRDMMLQAFQRNNMELETANRLIEMEAQANQSIRVQGEQNQWTRRMEYSNAVSSAINFGIEALGNAYLNPELTQDEFQAIQQQIQNMVQSQITSYQDIYGIEGATIVPERPVSDIETPDIGDPNDGKYWTPKGWKPIDVNTPTFI
jgi:hypothetical protein